MKEVALRVQLLLCFAWLLTSPSWAQGGADHNEVKYEVSEFMVGSTGPWKLETIRVSGIISPNIFSQLKEHVARSTDRPSLNFHLDSMGGDVVAAFELGRYLRSIEANILVPTGARCASACVIILAGGGRRTVAGQIGIHRPFIESVTSDLTASQVKTIADQMRMRLRAYFHEMNISEQLADDMMIIPSNRMKWLTRTEVDGYGLGADDPVLIETRALRRARQYGLSRTEFEMRWRRVQEICEPGSAADCIDTVMRQTPP